MVFHDRTSTSASLLSYLDIFRQDNLEGREQHALQGGHCVLLGSCRMCYQGCHTLKKVVVEARHCGVFANRQEQLGQMVETLRRYRRNLHPRIHR